MKKKKFYDAEAGVRKLREEKRPKDPLSGRVRVKQKKIKGYMPAREETESGVKKGGFGGFARKIKTSSSLNQFQAICRKKEEENWTSVNGGNGGKIKRKNFGRKERHAGQ